MDGEDILKIIKLKTVIRYRYINKKRKGKATRKITNWTS